MKDIKPKTGDKLLRSFLKEMFDFTTLKKIGFYPKEMKATDYQGQAKRICDFFGYKTVYEYGSKEIRLHISYADGFRPADEPFVTVIPNIYE